MGWISGVTIEEFLNPSTSFFHQGIQINSGHPQPMFQENYGPAQFTDFMCRLQP